MFQKIFLSLVTLCCLCSCVTFNTGAKLDSIGKAVPIMAYRSEDSFYMVNGVTYKEIVVEYRQINPKLVGIIILPHNINTCNDAPPAPDATGAPTPELYLVRLDNKQSDDMPVFIRAIDFDYTKAKRVDKKDLTVSYMDKSHFNRSVDLLTLTPSQYESTGLFGVLNGLPTIRTTGNKLRLPLAVAMSYGVDLPLTVASYAVGPVVYALFINPFTDM